MIYQIKRFEHPTKYWLDEKINNFLEKSKVKPYKFEFDCVLLDLWLGIYHETCILTYIIENVQDWGDIQE